MQCLQCQHENPSGAKFCNQCATPFVPQCASCGRENAAEAKFCNQCGTPLIAPTSTPDSVQSRRQEAESESRFQALLLVLMVLLRSETRVTYRTLQYAFGIDDALLAEMCEELRLRRLAIDEEGKVLVWTGASQPTVSSTFAVPRQHATSEATGVLSPAIPAPPPRVTPTNGPTGFSEDAPLDVPSDAPVVAPEPVRSVPEAERRQLTVMFCDLVGSTDLSGKLDPEDLRDVVRAYQETAAAVIEYYEGHIAQYLGDGLLIYFGYPLAHEDDAQRSVHTGLGIVEAMTELNTRLEADYGVQLAVRLGLHTGPVVVGQMGGGGRHENLALGETPNIAARLEGLAPSNGVVISNVTVRLVGDTFLLESMGPQDLKGVSEPMETWLVHGRRDPDRLDDDSVSDTVTSPLVGRDEEIGLLTRRWEQSKEGVGQVVLITGEGGIGKSSLASVIRRRVTQEGYPRITFQSSQYHQHSPLHPVIEHIQRLLGFERGASPEEKLLKLEQTLPSSQLPLDEVVPLFAALLSIAVPEHRYPDLALSPQQQRQDTLDALNTWLLEEAERQPMLVMWEDLQWADPTTLELLAQLMEQAPTAAMLSVLTYRPEFVPPWPVRSHMTSLTLNHLERPQVEFLVMQLAGGKRLPAEVVAHIVSKTDGVPLYIEELTKTMLESDLLEEQTDHYRLNGPLTAMAIPTTLQDQLMARLDRLPKVREVAQIGAVLGREFTYEVLQALMTAEEQTLQEGLAQLVDTELLYRRGRGVRATYMFKHALIQDAAYQSLLRRTRQQYHHQVATLLEARFPEIVDTKPEVVAHHYTEAGLAEPALAYWQQAGQRAAQRSAHQEAIAHLTKSVAMLETLPATPERTQQNLTLHVALGGSLFAVQGYAAPDVERVYIKARDLCEHIGETPQVFQVLRGLFLFYLVRGFMQTAQELAEQVLRQAEHQAEVAPRIMGHYSLGNTLFFRADLGTAVSHFQQAIALYDPEAHRELAYVYGIDPGVAARGFGALPLWMLGYPDRALAQSREGLALAQDLAHPFSQVFAQDWLAWVHQFRQEAQSAHDCASAGTALATEHGFALYVAWGIVPQGWALTVQGQSADGVARMREGMDAALTTGSELFRPYFLALLAEAYGNEGQPEEGLRLLREAREVAARTGEHFYEAEVHRLMGVLQSAHSDERHEEAEANLQQALAVARAQQAKSLELRAATSLARLWQSQDKPQDAYDLLAPVYGWFTEGFDTADFIDAKALLDKLRAEIGLPMA